MKTVLVTGASRGIGLAIAEQFALGGDRVIATCRTPESARHLQALINRFPATVSIEQLDVTDETSLVGASTRLGETPIDILVNNAGVLGGHHQSFHDLDFDAWRATLETNLIAPFRVSQTFFANLKKGADAKLVIISSELGSSTWPLGGLYIYASSKAALNRVVQAMAMDLRDDGIGVIAMHPGLVKTDLAGDLGVITAEESASGIHNVVKALKADDTGKFYQWNGALHSW